MCLQTHLQTIKNCLLLRKFEKTSNFDKFVSLPTMSAAIVPAAGEAGEVETAAQAEAAEDEGSESSPPSDEESHSNPYEDNPKLNTRFN